MSESRLTAIKDMITPEIWIKSTIKNSVKDSTRSLSKTAATIDGSLQDHPYVEMFRGNQGSLETKTELLRDRYQQVKSLPKGDRRLALKSAEKAADALISHVDTHVDVIRTSSLNHIKGSKGSEGDTLNPTQPRLSTGVQAPWHPVYGWDPKLIDAINDLGPSCAKIVEN